MNLCKSGMTSPFAEDIVAEEVQIQDLDPVSKFEQTWRQYSADVSRPPSDQYGRVRFRLRHIHETFSLRLASSTVESVK